MVFCNRFNGNGDILDNKVTILILIDGFLQYRYDMVNRYDMVSHNPYFNRWFSAIVSLPFLMDNLKTSQSLF